MNISDYDALRGCLQVVANLLKENLELVDAFGDMFKKVSQRDEFIDLYEALNYELKIRCNEAYNLVTNVNLQQQQQSLTITTTITQQVPNIITNDQIKIAKSQEIDPQNFYDWILDVGSIQTINNSGWKFYMNDQELLKGANLAVVGLYDKGKTHILNHITNSNLPTGQKITTKGISLKNSSIDSGTPIVLVDTAGNYAPANLSTIREKEQSQKLLMEIVFELADYFICVVNDFTSIEISYLDELSRKLCSSMKTFKEIIVIHNLREIKQPDQLEQMWQIQIQSILEGSTQKSKVEAQSPFSQQLEEKSILWFKTQNTRHICIVNDESDLGKSINPWTYSLLKYWLKAVIVPHNKQIKIQDLLQICEMKLSSYHKKHLTLELKDTHHAKEKRIMRKEILTPKLELSSDMPEEEFIPSIDILAGNQYVVLIDLPGMTLDEVEVYRQNVTTIIRGYRKWYLYNSKSTYLKNERKNGHFELKFKIPTDYDRKWSYIGMNNGVLGIVYDLDVEERIRK